MRILIAALALIIMVAGCTPRQALHGVGIEQDTALVGPAQPE
jgi:hypothetical protein